MNDFTKNDLLQLSNILYHYSSGFSGSSFTNDYVRILQGKISTMLLEPNVSDKVTYTAPDETKECEQKEKDETEDDLSYFKERFFAALKTPYERTDKQAEEPQTTSQKEDDFPVVSQTSETICSEKLVDYCSFFELEGNNLVEFFFTEEDDVGLWVNGITLIESVTAVRRDKTLFCVWGKNDTLGETKFMKFSFKENEKIMTKTFEDGRDYFVSLKVEENS